jgi:M6 family metalloprotease-like protein
MFIRVKKFIRLTIILILISVTPVFFGSVIYAAPHDGDIFQLMQPDNTLVDVKVYGDEYYQHVESMDGYTLIRDPKTDWICYAELAADGLSYVSTGIVYKPIDTFFSHRENHPDKIKPHIKIKPEARQKQARQNKQLLGTYNASGDGTEPYAATQPAIEPAPFGGNIVGMTLLIDFPDVKSSISRDEIISMLNQQGYAGYSNNGSVRDYFYDVSNGALTYTNQVTQFVTVSKPKSYYDDSSSYGHVKELIVEALNLLKAQGGYDFTTLSKTGDRFYAVNVMYAGSPSSGWAKGLWPHSGNLSGAWSINGVYVRNYQMTNIGTSLSIGTFVHENGHMLLGFPDLYAYDNHDKGVGSFCVMCSNNNKNPQMFNPYFRYLKGWLSYADIGNTNGSFSLTANRVDSAYYYGVNGGGTEFFLIESRLRTGRSTALPAEGMVIWHIYTQGDNTYTGSNNYVSVEQADGRNDMENNVNGGDANDTFRAGYKTDFNDTTSPNARYYTGVNSGLRISNVSAVGTTMTFMVGSGTVSTPTPVRTATPVVTSTPVRTATPVRVVTPTPVRTPTPRTGTPTPTPVRTPTAVRTATPPPATPTPPPGTGSIKVQFYNQSTAATTNQLYLNFQLVNTGSSAVTLSNVKMRYYYTKDGTQAQTFYCDYAQVGGSNVTGSFVTMSIAKTGADTYLEIGFGSGAGSLAAGAGTVIQSRVAKSDWSNYTQSNDYSFNATGTSYADWTKVTGYVSGALQWGVEP